MTTDKPMQLGMIGLGRMGANLVRRLMRDGHSCVAYDVNTDAVKARGRRRHRRILAGGFRRQAQRAPGDLADAAGGHRGSDAGQADSVPGTRRRGDRRRQFLLPRRHHPGKASRGKEDSLRRRRNQWRGVGLERATA